jgi:hypothetical protein
VRSLWVCCSAVSNPVGGCDKLCDTTVTLTEEEGALMAEQLSLITTGVVFAFLGAIVIGLL